MEDYLSDDSSLSSSDEYSDYVEEEIEEHKKGKSNPKSHTKPKAQPKTKTQAKKPAAGRSADKKASYRNVLTHGGRAAVARKVTADLNEDDQIIFNMKQEGSTDRQICNYLRESGRVDYSQKTIGTRWKRIRVALANAKDAELDRGVPCWTVKDDQALAVAVENAENAVAVMKQQAEDQKWGLVARELSSLKGVQLFSQRACRERFAALDLIDPVNYLVNLASEGDKEEDEAVEDTAADHHSDRSAPAVPASDEGASLFVEEIETEDKPATTIPKATPSALPPMALNFSIDSVSAERLQPLTVGLNPSTERPHPPARTTNEQRRKSRAITDVTALSERANRSISEEEHARLVREELDGMPLSALANMNRTELRAELQARGLRRDGIKANMLATVEASRAGVSGLPKSSLLPDGKPLREFLKRKAGQQAEGHRRPSKKLKAELVDDDDDEDDE